MPHRRTLGLSVALIALAMLTLTACGGGDDDDDDDAPAATATATTPPAGAGTTVDNADGDVSVALPPSSDVGGGSVTITKLPQDQWPAELSAVDARLVVQIGPDGAEFDEPVRVTLRLDVVPT